MTTRGWLTVLFAVAAVGLCVWRGVSLGLGHGLVCLLGIVATTIYLWGTWRAIVYLGRVMSQSAGPREGLIAMLAVLLKLPVIAGGIALSRQVGPDGPTSFLAGLALVYCALIGWGLTSDQVGSRVDGT